MRGKSLIFILMLVLLVSSALALTEVKVNTIDNRINFNEKALFRAVLSNERTQSQTYTFSSGNIFDWNVQTSPIANTALTIQANQTKGIDIEVIPLERFEPGIYLVSLNIKSDRGEEYKEPLEIYIGAETPREYAPALRTSVDVSDKIDPRETQSVKVVIQNQNPLNYSGLIVSVKSDLAEFEKEQVIDLKPYETRTVEFTVEPNKFTQPKFYYLFFALKYSDDEIIKTFDRKIEIIPLTTEFASEIVEQKSFLKNARLITFTNNGNVRNTQTAKFKMGLITDLFTSTDPNAYVYKDETGRYLAWDQELGVNEGFTVTATTSFRIPIIILIVLIVLIALYLVYRSPVRVTKAASNIIMGGAGLAGLKITLVVRNTGNRAIKDVEVFDTAPSIASIEKDVEAGTLKPTEILRGKNGGLLLKWKISELEGKEERLITYKIKSKLNIVGTILLSRAKVKFKVGKKGRLQTSYSNMYRVGGETENKE